MPQPPLPASLQRATATTQPPSPTRSSRWSVTLFCLAAISCGRPASWVPRPGFELRLGREHPLAGQIYAPGDHTFITSAQLFDALDAANFVLLGETHDNSDQHRLQAVLLERFLTTHADANVAFEMLDERVADIVSKHAYTTPEQLAEQVDWAESGWPDFALYRPIFSVALAHTAQLVAAHPSAENVRASMAELPSEELQALHLSEGLPAEQVQAEREEIREAHCGHGNDAMMTGMQRAQMYKDAFMARALGEGPSVLIAGRGHVRKDRGVPYFLRAGGDKQIVSIGLLDVDDARTQAGGYDVQAYDFVVFTPRVSDADPCELFRKQLEQMQQHHNASK
jgi:uncharacterized iron-regulated protein